MIDVERARAVCIQAHVSHWLHVPTDRHIVTLECGLSCLTTEYVRANLQRSRWSVVCSVSFTFEPACSGSDYPCSLSDTSCMTAVLRQYVVPVAVAPPLHRGHRLFSMSASLAQSQPSVSCSPNACFTPAPLSSSTAFQLAHSPLFPHHTRARSSHPAYPARFHVPDDRLDFAVAWTEYRPVEFTATSTAQHSSDPIDPRQLEANKWQTRPSSHSYALDSSSGRPLNPFGRTGLQGRGKLYNWGPNHAADCILLRQHDGQPQLLVIQRGDTGELALVGGMIDRGETPEQCIKREFGEEVMGIPEEDTQSHDKPSHSATPDQQRLLDAIFAPTNTRCVYRGYVDDARNTDNAWLETAAFMYTLPEGVSNDEVERLFVGGSDASAVKWVVCGKEGERLPQLYASHSPLVKLALKSQKGGADGADEHHSKM